LRFRSAPIAGAAAALACLLAAAPAQAAAPTNVTSPVISGNAREGATLRSSQGEWTGSPNAFFYQWLRCQPDASQTCVPIAGATQPEYALTPDDVGSRVRVEVVASNADGASPAQRSAATAVVRIPVPTLVKRPAISGSPREGETLTATTGDWTGSPTSYAYSWRRCVAGASNCPEIPGATDAAYVVQGVDVGSRIRVRVRATNAGGTSDSGSSVSTAKVRAASAGFKLGPARRDRKRGLARLEVTVPGPGTLALARTAKVKGDQRTVAAAGTYKLTVKARGAAKQRLRRGGKARVTARVSYAPTGGPGKAKQRNVNLRLGR
jgi:hypothetical protein